MFAAQDARFPHIVYFRLSDDRIEVIAALHAVAITRLWQRRTNEQQFLLS